MEPPKLNIFYRLLLAFAVICAAGTLSGFFGKSWWAFEAFSCFRVHFFLGLATASFAFIRIRNYPKSAVFALLAAVNFYHLIPFYLPPYGPVGNGKPLRVVTLNVHTGNHRFDLVLDYIASSSPEIVLLTEVNEEWLSKVKVLEKDYPHSISKPRSDNFGIVLFSRIPPERLELLDLATEEIPSILMTFRVGSSPCTLIGTHPLPPRNYEYTFIRNGQLKMIGKFFKEVQGSKILMGDLNTTPWSSFFHDLLAEAGLKDSAMGFGISVTWPVQAWWLFGIPIDHCLVSPELTVKSRKVGPQVGSDHYPIQVDLSFP